MLSWLKDTRADAARGHACPSSAKSLDVSKTCPVMCPLRITVAGAESVIVSLMTAAPCACVLLDAVTRGSTPFSSVASRWFDAYAFAFSFPCGSALPDAETDHRKQPKSQVTQRTDGSSIGTPASDPPPALPVATPGT